MSTPAPQGYIRAEQVAAITRRMVATQLHKLAAEWRSADEGDHLSDGWTSHYANALDERAVEVLCTHERLATHRLRDNLWTDCLDCGARAPGHITVINGHVLIGDLT